MSRTPALIRGVMGVRRTVNRGGIRMTRKPSMASSEGSEGSCLDVTTVTSWPRRASSRDRVRTWLSTPPKCGENHGVTCAMRTPATSEDPAPRSDVSPGVGPRTEERLLPDDRPRIDRCVDPHFHVVPHDDPELSKAGVDLDAAKQDPDRRLVESEVRHLRPRPEVASLAEDAVAHVVLMRHVRGGHEDRVFHFAGVADFRLRPY